MWLYKQTTMGDWSVGYYQPDGEWRELHSFEQEQEKNAQDLVHYLNCNTILTADNQD